MAKQRKRVDPIKQREKRAKIAAAVGGVVFLIVCAVEVPTLLSALNPKAPAPAAAATTPPPASSSSAPPLANVATPAAAAPAASGTAELANTDVPPAPSDGSQLVSFSVFPTKNPFAPQVPASSSASAGPTASTPTSTTPTSTTPTTTTTTTTATTPPPPPTTTPTSTTPPVVSAVPSSPGATTTTAAPQPTAAISVNGVVERVAQNGTFPSGSPVFRIVSWSRTTAQIGIVGGSYASGDATLTLQLGVAVTLQNQTDGKRYKLLLLSLPTP